MAILHPGRFLFLCTPHTASVSTTRALADIEGAWELDYKHIGVPEIRAGDFRKILMRNNGKSEVIFKQAPGVATESYHLRPDVYTGEEIVFSTVRNPYDLIATWWALDQYGYPSLAEFVDGVNEERFNNLDYLVKQGSRFIRYERLNEDLDALLNEVGLEPVTVPRLNQTPSKKPWREYYNADSFAAVNRRFSAYFDLYGYEMLEAA